MRDGILLRADVYRPEGREQVPAVLNRTPYDRSRGVTPPAALDPEIAVAAGLALVCQDVRGRHGSDGDFYPFRAEGHDGYDSVEWIASQPWSSGAVGMAGRSYSGATQWLAAARQPPHLAAICPVVTGSSCYDGWVYQGGAFQLGFNLFWVQLMTPRARGSLNEEYRHLPITEAPLLYRGSAGRFYRDWLEHPVEDDYWRALGFDRSYDRVEVPAFIVGGWYDLFLNGTLENYRRMRAEAATERARSATRLLIGPWVHGSTYGAYPDHGFDVFGPEGRIDLAALQVGFFRRHLGDEGRASTDRPVRIFVMGENHWRDESTWPPAGSQEMRWFLHSRGDALEEDGGGLSPDPPGSEPHDRYVYEPSDPAPTIGGPTSLPGRFMQTNAGPLDQRPVEARRDVLVYSSSPLEEPLEATGPLSVVLHAASSARDTDFVAKLCDVAPDGFSRILAEGVVRARFRDGLDRPALGEPGRVYEYRVDLGATSNVFLSGHRIRLVLTSSSFPRFDRNPNTGNRLGTDGPTDLQPAEQTIFHDDGYPSHLRLPVITR